MNNLENIVKIIKEEYPKIKRLTLKSYLSQTNTYVLKGFGSRCYPMPITTEDDLSEKIKHLGCICTKLSAVNDPEIMDRITIHIKKI